VCVLAIVRETVRPLTYNRKRCVHQRWIIMWKLYSCKYTPFKWASNKSTSVVDQNINIDFLLKQQQQRRGGGLLKKKSNTIWRPAKRITEHEGRHKQKEQKIRIYEMGRACAKKAKYITHTWWTTQQSHLWGL
jgi:hypothetical protein